MGKRLKEIKARHDPLSKWFKKGSVSADDERQPSGVGEGDDVPVSTETHIEMPCEADKQTDEALSTAGESSGLSTSEQLSDLRNMVLGTTSTGADERTSAPSHYEFQLGVLTAKARNKRAWQGGMILAVFVLIGSVVLNVWLYTDRQIQLDRLDQSYLGVQKVYDDYVEASRDAMSARGELESLKSEMLQLQKKLAESQGEGGPVSEQLPEAKAAIDSAQPTVATEDGAVAEETQLMESDNSVESSGQPE